MERGPLGETCPAPAPWVPESESAIPGDTCTRGGHRETPADGMLSMRINLIKGAASPEDGNLLTAWPGIGILVGAGCGPQCSEPVAEPCAVSYTLRTSGPTHNYMHTDKAGVTTDHPELSGAAGRGRSSCKVVGEGRGMEREKIVTGNY